MIRSHPALARPLLMMALLMLALASHASPSAAPCPANAGADGAATAGAGTAPVVIYLVRHAEKASGAEDPELTEAGRARAQALAHALGDAGIDTIHSTDFKRTRDTAAPLAERLGREIRIYDWDEMQALAAGMKCAGGRHLVVGHSDTTPELVGLLGGEPGPAIDEQSEYDRLYVVTVGPDGAVTTVLLRYGEM